MVKRILALLLSMVMLTLLLPAAAFAEEDYITVTIQKGDTVRIKGLNTIGTVENIQGKQITVIFGDVRTKMKAEQLERCDKGKVKSEDTSAANKHAGLAILTSKMTRATMEDRK